MRRRSRVDEDSEVLAACSARCRIQLIAKEMFALTREHSALPDELRRERSSHRASENYTAIGNFSPIAAQ